MTHLLSITPSRTKLAASRESEVYVQVTLNTPKTTGARRPLDIAVALDISGSMGERVYVGGGDAYARVVNGAIRYAAHFGRTDHTTKLDVAKDAIIKLIEHMSDDDTLTLITFESYVNAVFTATPMTVHGKASARAALLQLVPRSSTDLSGGLKAACLAINPNSARTQRVMLFTDGQANLGMTRADQLNDFILQKFTEHSISTFGFGTSYNSEMLGVATRNGGGQYYIDSAERIGTSFGTEFGAMTSLYAKDIELSLHSEDARVKIEVINPIQVDTLVRNGIEATVKIPQLLSDTKFDVIAKLTFPRRSKALKRAIDALSVSGTLQDVATGGELHFASTLKLSFVNVADAELIDNQSVMQAVTVQEAARAQKEAQALARAGRVDEGRRVLTRSADRARTLGHDDVAKVMCEVALSGFASNAAYASVGDKMLSSVGATYTAQVGSTGGASYGGVKVDNMFSNPAQKKFAGTFSIKADKSADDDMPLVSEMVTSK